MKRLVSSFALRGPLNDERCGIYAHLQNYCQHFRTKLAQGFHEHDEFHSGLATAYVTETHTVVFLWLRLRVKESDSGGPGPNPYTYHRDFFVKEQSLLKF
jgi:hypothetical protein